MRKIYVASSWRCEYQPSVVMLLRAAGHEVYDFRNPAEGNHGFHWSEIDKAWEKWDRKTYRDALRDPVAEEGFTLDYDAMKWADTCVLVLPCGRSAHLEAGYFVGARKGLHILITDKCEPELMYKMATSICLSVDEILYNFEVEEEAMRESDSPRYVTLEMALDAGDPSLEGERF